MAEHKLIDTDGDEIPYGFEAMMKPCDVARIMSVSPRTITNWAKEGRIRCVMTAGGHRRFPADAVRAMNEGRWEDAAVKGPVEDMSPADVLIHIED